MDINRRNFLGAMAATPVAARVAAGEAMKHSGIEVLGAEANGLSVSGDVACPSEDECPSLFDTFELLGHIPDWQLQEFRRQAGRNRTLDPDLAEMRSLSLSSKLRIQRERNFKHIIEWHWQDRARESARQAFAKKHNCRTW